MKNFLLGMLFLSASVLTQHRYRVLVEIGPSVQQYVVIVADTYSHARLLAETQYGKKNVKSVETMW